jgi:cytochrome oxidase assembly protein ShyY1
MDLRGYISQKYHEKKILDIFSPSKNVSGALLIGCLCIPPKKKSTTKKQNKNNFNLKK